jgi:hypothetical protein
MVQTDKAGRQSVLERKKPLAPVCVGGWMLVAYVWGTLDVINGRDGP